MAKYYIVASEDLTAIIDRNNIHDAVHSVFMRIYKIVEKNELGEVTPFPRLMDKIYIGEMGYPIKEDGTIRPDGDVFVMKTEEVLRETGLDRYYRPIGEGPKPYNKTQNPPPKKDDDENDESNYNFNWKELKNGSYPYI